LYYAADGRLERVDHPDGPGPSIVESAYQAPPTLPLSAKEIWRGTKLELLGWGDDRYVSFLDGKGHRVDFWSGGTVVEHDGEASAPLVRVTLRNYFTIVKRGHETSSGAPSDRVTVAERIEGLSGAGWDQSVVYVDAQGRRGQRFASGARSEFDAAGRLVRHTDERNRVFELGYAKDGSLESAATPDRRVRRGSLSDGVRDFRLTPSGALVLIRDSGLEMYGFPGGRRITIGPDGTLSKYDHRDRLSYEERLDGARALLIYDSDTASSAARKQEVAGAKRPREAVATLDIALDQGRLRTLERSVKGRDGKPTRTVIVRADRGEWIDDEQNRYAAAWIGQNPRRVVLVTGDGRLMRVVHDDGGETRVGYDEHYERRFGVTRNARGEVVNVQHADWSVTRFERNDSGRVTMLQRGPDVVVFNSKNSPAGFEPSISPRSRWPVSLQVDGQGTQIWSGKSGLQRTVAPDGRIEVSRPDGSKTFFLADGGRRHVFPARAGATLSEVTEHQNGDIEWVLSDGSAGRYADHGLVTESLKKDRTPALDGQGRPLRARGYAAVTPRGDLTLLDLDRGTLVVRHADGRVTEFQSAGAAGWRAPDTGEVFASWGEIQQRLTAIGAATPGHSSRHLDLAEVEGANRIRLTLGMFEYEAPAIEPPRRPAPLATRSQRERAITSVMLNPGGTPQIGYASSAQPPPNRSR
jgi:YD repeat-containing protein